MAITNATLKTAAAAPRERSGANIADWRPEDESFWQRVGEKGSCGHILSDSYVTHAGGQAVPVVRRVSRIEPAPGNALYVVADTAGPDVLAGKYPKKPGCCQCDDAGTTVRSSASSSAGRWESQLETTARRNPRASRFARTSATSA